MVKQLAAALDLCAVFAAMLTCLTVPTRRAGWVLAVLSALWPVLNNRVFEGPVLLTVDRRHGVTAADLIALAGYVLAAEVVARTGNSAGAGWRVAGVVALAVCGELAAYRFQ